MAITSANLIEELGAAGDVARPFEDVWRALLNQPHVPAATLELCRLSLARMHRAPAEMACRMALVEPKLSEDKISSLLSDNWANDPLFSDSERAVLDFTQWYHADPQSIPDGVANEVIKHLGPAGFVALIEALGFIDGRIRVALIYSRLRD